MRRFPWLKSAVVLASASTLAGCGANHLTERVVEDTLQGSVSVMTENVAGSGPLSTIDGRASGTFPGNPYITSKATGDGFGLTMCDIGLHCITFWAIAPTSTAPQVVQLCSCPDDHPFSVKGDSEQLGGGACESVSAGQPSVPALCQALEANLTIIARASRACQTLHQDDLPACSEKLEADVTIPAVNGALFSGTLSVRHEIDIVSD